MGPKRKFLLLLTLWLTLPAACPARDIALYNHQGEAVAYIDTDNSLTIYLWDGEPVAYLDHHSIYGFNGKYLGWLEGGIVRDHGGNAVGFVEGAVSILTQLPPLKGLPKLAPPRSLEETAPLQPRLHINSWSDTPLATFLTKAQR